MSDNIIRESLDIVSYYYLNENFNPNMFTEEDEIEDEVVVDNIAISEVIEKLDQIVFNLESHMEVSDDGNEEYAKGVEQGMLLAAESVKNYINKLKDLNKRD